MYEYGGLLYWSRVKKGTSYILDETIYSIAAFKDLYNEGLFWLSSFVVIDYNFE